MTPPTDHEDLREPAFSFYGAYERAVDAKGRFNLPYRFRKKGGGTVEIDGYVVSIGRGNCLTLWPAVAWQKTFNTAKRHLKDSKWQDQVRVLSANSSDVEPDTQGRVMVPVTMLVGVGIGRRIKVVGMNHYMELWDPVRFEDAHRDQVEVDPEFLSEIFF